MKVDNKIVQSDIGVTYRTIEFTDKAIDKLKIISTKKNIDVRFKSLPYLSKKDVQTTPNGVNGPDIILSRTAKKLCPYNFEVKNRNQMKGVYDWYKQSGKNTKLEPVVVMKMNTRKPLVVIDLDTFVDLIR